ncbi:hypothetical protein ACIGBH_41965 [Streptomyces sp. NPDC085929]|uniref:hypothetical protein n=1 Tax=Streptomyces sp. NPDC085929 TaxID=3365739 RepID=UPI0037D2FD9F
MVIGDIHLPDRPAVSGYLHQVRRLATFQFQGRVAELEEMAAFCTAPAADEYHDDDPNAPGGAGLYWRWLAPMWAGKTALLAHFVLHPPAGVDVVCFFITGRLAGQSDRTAFCEVLRRQLCELLGEAEPAVTEHTRDEQLLLLLDRAAGACAERGRRLVLVVDGLDEDKGVTPGPGGHSIAALLPARPPHGARVLVAGRPHPPVPRDVPPGHPLRDHRIDHSLTVFEDAAVIRAEAEDCLLAAVESGVLGAQLVGLIAAAGGGLSAADLARLVQPETTTLLVQRELNSVGGRAFNTRDAHWDPEIFPEVYLFSHEELHRTALELITISQLGDYRVRLGAWSQHYRDQGWPRETPEYLLRGYPRLLREIGDARQLANLAADPQRHDLLRKVSGSDLDALDGISAAFTLLLDQAGPEGPDVARAVLLALRRDALRESTIMYPLPLITMWGLLGQMDRAARLARSFARPETGAIAMTQLAYLARSLNQTEKAWEFTQEAMELNSRSSPDSEAPATALYLTTPEPEADGSIVLGAGTGEGFTDMGDRALSLASDAAAFLLAGERYRGIDLIAEAVDIARNTGAAGGRAHLLAEIAVALAGAGEHQWALDVADEAADIARHPHSAWDDAHDEAGVAVLLAHGGEHRRAIDLARSIGDTSLQALALADVAVVLAQAGEHCTAIDLVDEAVRAIRRIDDLWVQAHALAGAGVALAHGGEHRRAIDLARSIGDTTLQALALADVAVILAHGGEHRRAIDLARSIGDTTYRARALADVAVVLAQAGEHHAAIDLADEVTGSNWTPSSSKTPARAAASAAVALAYAGELDKSTWLAAVLARPWGLREHPHNLTLSLLAAVLAHTSLSDAPNLKSVVTDFTRNIDSRLTVAHAVANVAVAFAMAGTSDWGPVLPDTRHPGKQAMTLPTIVASVPEEAGRQYGLILASEAVDVARTLSDPCQQTAVLSHVAKAYGPTPKGRQLLAESLSLGPWQCVSVTALHRVAPQALAEAARCLTEDG